MICPVVRTVDVWSALVLHPLSGREISHMPSFSSMHTAVTADCHCQIGGPPCHPGMTTFGDRRPVSMIIWMGAARTSRFVAGCRRHVSMVIRSTCDAAWHAARSHGDSTLQNVIEFGLAASSFFSSLALSSAITAYARADDTLQVPVLEDVDQTFVVTGGITWTVPILLFALAFGLSMDYAGFMLARFGRMPHMSHLVPGPRLLCRARGSPSESRGGHRWSRYA